jgi:hypothetical protein
MLVDYLDGQSSVVKGFDTLNGLFVNQEYRDAVKSLF